MRNEIAYRRRPADKVRSMGSDDQQEERSYHRHSISRIKPPQPAKIKLAPFEIIISLIVGDQFRASLSSKRKMDAKSAENEKKSNTEITPS